MKSNYVLAFGSILVIGLLAVVFIYFTNDHAECFNEIETVNTLDGRTVITEKHICKENYNL